MKNIDVYIKLLLIPLLSAITIGIMIFYLATQGYTRVKKQSADIKTIKNNISVLEHKVAVLNQVKKGILSDSDNTLVALPVSNPGLILLSQLRDVVQADGYVITGIDLKNGNATVENVRSMEITIQLSGNGGNIETLLKLLTDIKKSAPVNTIASLSVGGGNNIGELVMSVSFYWSDLPTVVPAVNQPVTELTSKETLLLDQISQLIKPQIVATGGILPAPPTDRQNPFQ